MTSLLQQIAQRRTDDVVYSAIGLTIEKIAAEAAAELLKDAAFREELRALARQSVARAFRSLHRPNGRPTVTRKRRRTPRAG